MNPSLFSGPQHSSLGNAIAHPNQSAVNPSVSVVSNMAEVSEQGTQQREETNRSSYKTNILANKLSELVLEPYQKKRYPVKRSPVMSKTIQDLAPKDPDRLAELASSKESTSATIKELLSLLKLGPHEQFLGWQLLDETVANTLSDPVEMHWVAKHSHQGYQKQKDAGDKSAKIKFGYWLGKVLSPYLLMPGDGWTFMPITGTGNDDITGIHFEKDDCLSVMDFFNDQPQLPDEVMKGLHVELNKAAIKNVISAEEKARAISNLKPVSTYFPEGRMVVDLVILPKLGVRLINGQSNYFIDEQRKNYVYVECTPRDKSYLQPRQVFMAEDIVVDETNNIRLSDQLREDIQAYFQSKGWDNCLGKTLRLNPEDPVLNTSNLSEATDYENLIDCNNKNPETLENAFQLCSNNRAIIDDNGQTLHSKEIAKCKMEAVKGQIYRWAEANIEGIDLKYFKRLIIYLSNKVSIATHSECSLQILKAVKQLIKMQKGSIQDFKKYKEMLNAMRIKFEPVIKFRSIKDADETMVYLLINELNMTITALDEIIAGQDGTKAHQNEHLVEEEKTGS